VATTSVDAVDATAGDVGVAAGAVDADADDWAVAVAGGRLETALHPASRTTAAARARPITRDIFGRD